MGGKGSGRKVNPKTAVNKNWQKLNSSSVSGFASVGGGDVSSTFPAMPKVKRLGALDSDGIKVDSDLIISGDVGIGTTSPGAPLHVKDTGSSGMLFETTQVDGEAKTIYKNDAQYWQLGVFGDDKFYIQYISGTWVHGLIMDTSGNIKIPNGTLDMNDNQIINVPKTISITIENPSSSEDITIAYFPNAVTISNIECVVVGSSTPSVTINPLHHTSRSNAGNTLLDSATAITDTTTGTDISGSSLNDNTLPAASFLWLETTAQSGTVDELHLTFKFTED